MVFERLYSEEFLNKHKYIILLISLAYTVFGIAGSLLLFNKFNPSTTALALISLVLFATLRPILRVSDRLFEDAKKRQRSFKEIFSEYRNVLAIFGYVFVGIMVCYASFTLLLPVETSASMFDTQFQFIHTGEISELFDTMNFGSVFMNNLVVLAVALITSFLFGIGTVFLFIVVWNASLIGVVFGVAALQTIQGTHIAPIILFLIVILASLPHILFEISAYLLAGIAGENFSNDLFFKKSRQKYFALIMDISSLSFILSVLLLILGAFSEILFAPFFIKLFL